MADQTLAEALSEALSALDAKPEDAAAIALAKRYAALLDGEEVDVVKHGPLFLSVLESLGMTPKGRAVVLGKGGGKGAPTGNRLDELRAKRRARANGAAPVDSATP